MLRSALDAVRGFEAVPYISYRLNEYWAAPFLVFLPLAVRNEDGQLKEKLAQRWEHSADYREWTYHLRRGVRWHDGAPVTAHDVKFTMDLWTHPKVHFASLERNRRLKRRSSSLWTHLDRWVVPLFSRGSRSSDQDRLCGSYHSV